MHALAAIAFGSIECRDYVLKTIIREQPTYQMNWFQNQVCIGFCFFSLDRSERARGCR